MMKLNLLPLALVTFLASKLPTSVVAAPPGVMRWETLASPSGCGGEDLFSIGFIGGTGTSCLSLADDAPSDEWLNYFLDDCTVYLFSEAGCADDTLVFTGLPPPSPGAEFCIDVGTSFRALNVTCNVDQ